MFRFKVLIATIICLALSFVPDAHGNDQSDQYLIELQILVTDQKVSMDCHRVDTGDGEDLVSAGDVYTMTLGDIELDLESDLIWNGQAGPPEDSGIELLTAPRLVVPAGEIAKLRIGSAAQYLEQRDENCYTVETLPPDATPGIFLEVMSEAGPADDDGAETVNLDFKLRIATIGNRETLPGISLDVGRPTIHTKEVDSRYRYRLDRWNLISSHITRDPSNPDGEKLLVLIRVTRPPAR